MTSGQLAGILAAGGSGERARDRSDPTPKQFRNVLGRPLWRWSYDMLHAVCDEVIFVVPASYLEPLTSEGVNCVAGGPTRQASVQAGLAAVGADRVVVHDAARPLVTRDLVARAVAALDNAEGATAAVPLHDTIVRVGGELLSEVIEREHVWRVQTPQAFRREALEEAHRRALEQGITDASDDAQLLRAIGKDVAVVRGDERNIKVTDLSDLELVEALLGTV